MKPIIKACNSKDICRLKKDKIPRTKAVSVAIGIAHPFINPGLS
ncbi:putative na+/H+ antiporter NhaA [Rickettsia felis str. Pedreira]|uniref:Putative na+/H+ antiporter NhaA n=1 Tax=Rickettsia felis str. Pedreira TaxID=1359196 RepID=A0A0F3MT30_RICFI|nr:putative na+/H+ antiporter NhaA [Rickettsia felis str. Pedreira]